LQIDIYHPQPLKGAERVTGLVTISVNAKRAAPKNCPP